MEPKGSVSHSQESSTSYLSWARQIQSIPSHPVYPRSILICNRNSVILKIENGRTPDCFLCTICIRNLNILPLFHPSPILCTHGYERNTIRIHSCYLIALKKKCTRYESSHTACVRHLATEIRISVPFLSLSWHLTAKKRKCGTYKNAVLWSPTQSGHFELINL
jgi:hypothetical protein